jgi:hypothetical protein
MFTNRKKSSVFLLATLSILVILLGASSGIVSASSGSIANANCFPKEGETYAFIDYFTYQISAVNSNTTVSVSIDGGQPIPMTYLGLISDNASNSWYTWEITIPTMSTPGNRTCQFFSHYYVWQEADKYWAEFNFASTVKTFTIDGPVPDVTAQPQLTTDNLMPALATLIAFPALVILACALLVQLRTNPRRRIDTH